MLNYLSARRLAAISFDKLAPTEEMEISIEKANALHMGGHFSPFEAQARPLDYSDVKPWSPNTSKIMIPVSSAMDLVDTDGAYYTEGLSLDEAWCGNFRGWWQMRKEFDNEEMFLRLKEWAR
jgi:hypothetical protein